MKKITYILTVIFLVFTSCQNETLLEGEDLRVQDEEKAVHFSLDIPQFTVMTKGNTDFEATIEKIELYTFDANGIFLGKATEVSMPDENKRGTALLSTKTRVIHFVINSTDTQTFTPDGELTEADIIPMLKTTTLGYWGRKEVTLTDLQSRVTVELIRNYAKISFNGDKYAGATFALANNPKSAKVAVFDEDESKSFTPIEDVLTLPEDLGFWKYGQSDVVADVALEEVQYLFETGNATLESGDTPTFLIAKIGEKYYKFQLILSAVEACKIERNYHYEIVFEDFELDPSFGHDSFEEAAEAEAVANDIFAEIIKHSPGIMDSKNNKIEVEKLAYQMKKDKTIYIPANYFVNGVATNDDVQCTVKSGGEYITVAYDADAGKIEVYSKANGEAVIMFADPEGLLKREIKISVTDGFEFTRFDIVNGTDGEVDLHIGLPAKLDKAYFPLQLKIRANNIAPVKGLIIRYEENGTTYYLYEVTEDLYNFESVNPTVIELPFKTSLSEEETVTVDHVNFLPITATFTPKDRILFFDQLSYKLCGYDVLIRNGIVVLTYGSEEKKIVVENGKILNPVVIPRGLTEEVTISYGSVLLSQTVTVEDLADGNITYKKEIPTGDLVDIKVNAKLSYYRMDTKATKEYGKNEEIRLVYPGESGNEELVIRYGQTDPIQLPADLERVVLYKRVDNSRVYVASPTVAELQATENIFLVYEPKLN